MSSYYSCPILSLYSVVIFPSPAHEEMNERETSLVEYRVESMRDVGGRHVIAICSQSSVTYLVATTRGVKNSPYKNFVPNKFLKTPEYDPV